MAHRIVATSKMATSEQIIKELLQKKSISKDKDVEELYLACKNLKEVYDLSRFKYLTHLWLNSNKLRRISCLQENFRLKELYLQDNQLVEITGALGHLTCLQVLMLHNNQLSHLENIVNEVKKMQSLKTLNLFNNPIAQEADYRIFVINYVPSVDLLDRQEVLKSERDLARRIYDQNQEKIRDSIAFGRRADNCHSLYYSCIPETAQTDSSEKRDVGNSFFRDNPPLENVEDAVNIRRLKKSVTIYTSFDWTKVPRLEERRTSNTAFDSPEVITHVYR